ncbi:MAG: hypothetical protein GY953_33340 [bacterium]|nr:hypothetical protein [bacterium]
MRSIQWKVVAVLTALTLLVGAGLLYAGVEKPSSVIHVVTVKWKADATEAQIKAALDGVVKLGESYDGISRVWIRSIKAQGEPTHAFVMEFTSEQALKDYAGSAAQKEWYKVYQKAVDFSITSDITN